MKSGQRNIADSANDKNPCNARCAYAVVPYGHLYIYYDI